MLLTYLILLLEVEEEKQLEAMLWPIFTAGRHKACRGVLTTRVKSKMCEYDYINRSTQ